jgi:quinol monooxygenase YgiN
MVVLTARIVASPSERRELAQALLAWLAAARRAADLHSADVYEDLEVPATFGLVSEWRTSTGLDAHLRSDAFGVLMGALKVLARQHRLLVSQPDNEHMSGAIAEINRPRSAEATDA